MWVKAHQGKVSGQGRMHGEVRIKMLLLLFVSLPLSEKENTLSSGASTLSNPHCDKPFVQGTDYGLNVVR